MVLALSGGLGRARTLHGGRLGGSGLQTILRSFDKSHKGLPTPVSINSKAEITGVRLFGFSLKTLWLSVILEAVVLGVVQGLFGGKEITE